jgi:hypothetical protein
VVRQNTLPDRVFQQFPTFDFAPFQSRRVEIPMPHQPASMHRWCARTDLQHDFSDRAAIRK